jgi:hypothetical protein
VFDPGQLVQPDLIFAGEVKSLSKELHLERLLPYLRKLEYVGKACQGKNPSLLRPSVSDEENKRV